MCEFHLLIVVETYEVYELATQAELKPERVGEGFLGEFVSLLPVVPALVLESF